MAQNTDAQSRTPGTQAKSSAVIQQGTRFLDVAVAVYLTTLAAFVALVVLGIQPEASKLSATVLLIVPVAFLGMTFGFYYSVAFVSSLASVPLISFSNGLSAIQRNWRGIAGAVLTLAVVSSVLTLAIS